jgi:hypothetical protein
MRLALSVLRAYWSAWLLGAAAVVLLALGAPARAALAGAGFAFVGAAVTRAIDLAKERRAEAAQADKDRLRDLDETRRLAYAALVAQRSNSRDPVLIATLLNALAHHGSAVEQAVAAEHLRTLNRDDSQRWLQGQIDRINAELGA